ncbi:hypothetical protein TeGR_g2055, partial [Tetraparma gracilis]
KIPGGEIEDCKVINGVMFNKDVTHPKMRRRIENPRILLLDCPLEYKKGESQTNVEITDEEDWNTMLRMEEEYIENMCAEIIAFKPDIVITEKGVSDLAQYVQEPHGRKRVRRRDEIQESDIGTGCGLFEVRKLGDEYFTFLEDCKDAKACTILIRGGSKDVLNEVERNLGDAMQVVRNVVFEPKLLLGGGCTEMAIACALAKEGLNVEGTMQWPFQAVGEAMEVIPRVLAQNCGVSVVRAITKLRAEHSKALQNGGTKCEMGINGISGEVANMNDIGLYEPFSVKIQTIKTSIESACMILRIDDIVSGSKHAQ